MIVDVRGRASGAEIPRMHGKMREMDSLGLYLSIPFCKAKCSFCNFASDAFPPERMAEYVEQICTEIVSSHSFAATHGMELPGEVDSIFLGGGTPSLLDPGQMLRIFRTLRENFQVSEGAEITVEAAPGQICERMLDALLECGVNRMSLGVQSFVDAEARAVGRKHTALQCLTEIRRLREAGIHNLSVDLIAGLPHQTSTSWVETLQEAVVSAVDHVSVYMLEVDEDSRLGRELIGPGVRYGANAAPDESLVVEMYLRACETLTTAGLQQYEISNFARRGHRSSHNCKYWTRAPYLGFGLDAHSMLQAQTSSTVRFANGDDLDLYLAGGTSRDLEHVSRLAAWEETVFLGLRLVDGLAMADLRSSYPRVWIDSLLAAARTFGREGLMGIESDRIFLTQRGRILSSSIFGELLTAEPVSV